MPANLVNSIVASRPQGASSARGGGGEAQPYCTSQCGDDGVEGFANIDNNVCSDFRNFWKHYLLAVGLLEELCITLSVCCSRIFKLHPLRVFALPQLLA